MLRKRLRIGALLASALTSVACADSSASSDPNAEPISDAGRDGGPRGGGSGGMKPGGDGGSTDAMPPPEPLIVGVASGHPTFLDHPDIDKFFESSKGQRHLAIGHMYV